MGTSTIATGMAVRSRRNISWGLMAGAAAAAVVAYLVIVPLAMLLFSSLRATKGVLPFEATSFTLSNYVQVFSSPLTYKLLWNTVAYGLGALVIGLALALAFAWFLERTNAPVPSLLVMLVLAPLGVPPIVEAMAWILIANPTNGILNVVLRAVLGPSNEGPINIYSILGMAWVSGLKMVPSAYILVASLMASMDPTLEEASVASGASPLTTFRRVTAALLRPGILAVVIYFGVVSIELFEIPALLGMPTGTFVFSTLIYDAIHPPMGLPDYGLASGYAAISLIIATGLMYTYHLMVRRQERFAVVTGRGYRPRRLVLRRRWRVLFVSGVALYVLLAALLPALVLIWASLGILYTPSSLQLADLDSYAQIFTRPGMARSIVNTLFISLGSATATMILALLTSWLAIRSRFFGSTLPDRITILTVAMPSVVIALALIFFYTRFPLPIYGTVWIIMIALITRFLAFGARLMNAAYIQIHRELEEAAEASGASWWTTITQIVLPLIWPAFIRGWLWVFVHALRDATLALMLFTVENDTIAVRLWLTWVEGAHFELGAAIAVPLMLISVGLSLILAKPSLVRAGV